MSEVGVPVKAQTDPVLVIDTKDVYDVTLGAAQVNWQQVVAQPPTINSVVYQIQPTSQEMVLDPKVYFLWSVTLQFTGTSNNGTNLLQLGTSDGPRALPICAAIGTGNVNVNINGTNTSSPQMDFQAQLACYALEHEEDDRDMSMTPCMLDTFQNYNDWTRFGSARNPLALQGENAFREPRGGFNGLVVNSNTPTSASVTLTVAEPVFVSPLAQVGQEKGLVGLSTFQIQVTIQDLTRMWSHDAIGGNTISSIVPSFATTPQLLTRFMQPYNPIRRAMYAWNMVQRYVQAGTSLAPGASAILQSQSIEISVIPSKIYLFAKPTTSQLTYNVTDCVASVTNVQVTWAGQPYMFAATQRDLYARCAANGLKMSWSEFSLYRGSVLCLQPGVDFPLPPGDAPGVERKVTASFQVTAQNVNSSQTYTFDLFTIMQQGGVWVLDNGSGRMINKTLADRDVAAAGRMPATPMKLATRLQGGNFSGGAWYNSLWNGIKSVANAVGTYGPKVISAVNAVRPIFGMGLARGGSLAMPVEDEPQAKRLRGGGYVDESSDAQMNREDERADLPGPRGGKLPLKSALPLKKLDSTGSLPFRR